MKKHIILLGILSILLFVELSGCNQINTSYTTEKNKFIGTWVYTVPSGTESNYTFTYIFFSNGTFLFQKPSSTTNGTFDLIDGNLWLMTNITGKKNYDECTYQFSENNTCLTIDEYTYTKQESTHL
jgi:hypothetical protein